MADTADPQNDPTNRPEEESPEESADTPESEDSEPTAPKWPGWPGDNVFRLIVPVLKVGGLIGRKGEVVKKLCDETRARVRVLDAPLGTPDRVVLISGKEEPDTPLSPAMDAAIRVFKRITGLDEDESKGSAAEAAAFCSQRLLVPSSQAINLIGKQGSTIKSIQENSGAVVRILPDAELPSYATSDERIVEIHGEAFKVLKGLEGVLAHLRKFLHDHSVVAVFEKTYNETISQKRPGDDWADKSPTTLAQPTPSQTFLGADHSFSSKRESYLDREYDLETKLQYSSLSLYGSDPAVGGLYSTGLSRASVPIVTQITQTMQVPLAYAEDIIGIAGRNIAYIRRTSGAALTVEESLGGGDEITVEIKGTATQVQTAQQLIQESISGQKATLASSMYRKPEVGLSSSAYSRLSDSSYLPSSYSSQGQGQGGRGGYSSSSTYRY